MKKEKALDPKKITWNLQDVYKNIEDPAMDKDIKLIAEACSSFAKKYAKDDSYLTDETMLLKSLVDYAVLAEKITVVKPLWYLYNMQSIDSSNSKIDARIGILEPKVTQALNETIFYTLKLAKLSIEKQNQLLKNPSFTKYAYFLGTIFKTAKYDLTEDTEKVLNLLNRPAASMWSDGFEKLLNKSIVVFKGKKIPMAEALNKVHQLSTADRRNLDTAIKKELQKIEYFAEQEINAVFTTKKITDELRGFKTAYESTILRYENEVKSIENLVETVTANFKISHRFYNLKKKVLGLPHLKHCDRAVGISKVQKPISFSQSVEILKKSFGAVDSEYVEILERMLANGKVDVPSRVGKRGGAYCWGGYGVPTLVLLNYVPSVDSVLTYAHEMGHAIHTELSNKQPALYSHYTISVAEVASTFFENLAFKFIYEEASEKEKFYLLYDRVADSIQTIFRQIGCFNFEKDLHATLRADGVLTSKKIKELHNKNMSAYMGPAFKLDESDGSFFEVWSHIRNHFYVYSYAYGEIISKALYRKCEQNPEYFKTVKKFMLLGRSMSPDDIFKAVGLDTTTPSFFKEALTAIDDDIKTLELLYKKIEKSKKK